MIKKKIGCVIAYSEGHNNYGTYLQDYAMLRKIQELGYEVEVIRYVKHLSVTEKVTLVGKMIKCHYTQDKLRAILQKLKTKSNTEFKRNLQLRTDAQTAYKEKNIKQYFAYYNGYEALHEGSKKYGAVLVGSDQVWTPMSLYSKYYNLLFVDDTVPKLAYASSFGVSSIPDFQLKATGEYLDRFQSIGVREESGKNIVDSLSHKKATIVSDPTLLLTKDEWRKEAEKAEPISKESYIFCYFLGTNPDARRAATDLKKRTGLKIVTFRHMDEWYAPDERFGDEAPYNVDSNCFIKTISEASYVCTDSFHCSVFSILFHRKFMTFYRYKQSSKSSRNSRIDSLFDLLGIPKAHIYKDNITNIDSPIDWSQVEVKLTDLRSKSIQFLKDELQLAK